MASGSNPTPAVVPDNVNVRCFEDGYRVRARSRNVRNSVVAASVGAVIFPALLLTRLLR